MHELGLGKVDEGPHVVRANGARARLHLATFRAEALKQPILQGRCVERGQETKAPRIILVWFQLVHPVFVFLLTLIAVGGVHIFVMSGVKSVLDGALVVVVDVKAHDGRAPLRVVLFFDLQNWRTLSFGQVAQEREHDAILFLNRITVDARACRDFGFDAERGNARAFAFCVETPAMIGALHGAVFFALATCQ